MGSAASTAASSVDATANPADWTLEQVLAIAAELGLDDEAAAVLRSRSISGSEVVTTDAEDIRAWDLAESTTAQLIDLAVRCKEHQQESTACRKGESIAAVGEYNSILSLQKIPVKDASSLNSLLIKTKKANNNMTIVPCLNRTLFGQHLSKR